MQSHPKIKVVSACFGLLFCVQITKPNKICPNAILLMKDILHHLECTKPGINYQPQQVIAGFLNHRRTSGVCPVSFDQPHLPLPGRDLNLGKRWRFNLHWTCRFRQPKSKRASGYEGRWRQLWWWWRRWYCFGMFCDGWDCVGLCHWFGSDGNNQTLSVIGFPGCLSPNWNLVKLQLQRQTWKNSRVQRQHFPLQLLSQIIPNLLPSAVQVPYAR